MSHGAMLWSAALYNNGAFPLKNPHFGESYDLNGQPSATHDRSPADSGRDTHKGRAARPAALAALGDLAAEQRASCLRTRRVERGQNSAIRCTDEEPGKPDDQTEFARLRHDAAYRSRVVLGLQKTRLLDPMLYFPGHERSSRVTTAPADAAPATSSMRTTARRSTPGHTRSYGHSGTTVTRRSHDPEEQAGLSAPAPVHPRHAFEHLHGVSHAPGDEHGDHLLRLHVVGQRSRRRVDVSEEAAGAQCRRAAKGAGAKSRNGRRCADCGATSISWKRRAIRIS